MEDKQIRDIHNYRRLSEEVATAGQPSEPQLEAVAHSGFEVVINLGLTGEKYSLPDEKGLVESLGLEYVHIPVLWEKPTSKDLHNFMQAMDTHQGRKLFIHCYMNKRVSVFMALYRILRLGWEQEKAMADLYAMWEPDDVWRTFINNELSNK